METKQTSGCGGVPALADRVFQQWWRRREGRARIPERRWRMASLTKTVLFA